MCHFPEDSHRGLQNPFEGKNATLDDNSQSSLAVGTFGFLLFFCFGLLFRVWVCWVGFFFVQTVRAIYIKQTLQKESKEQDQNLEYPPGLLKAFNFLRPWDSPAWTKLG